jgi:hypothetical protein
VIGAELAAEIELHSVREAAQRGVLGDAIEDDVGKRRIAHEIERAVLGEGRDSEIERRLGMEIGEHEELAGLVLLLVELRRIERGDGLAVEEAYAGERRRGRIVRDLEVAVEQAGDRRHAVLGVDDVFEIGKGVPLQRTVVDLGQRRRHPLDAVVGAEEIAGEVVVVAAERAAVFRAGVQRVVAAAIHRDGATRGEQPALRLDVDDARGAEAVAPVIRVTELANRGLKPWPKKLSPVGSGIPLMRNSTGCISLWMWMPPAARASWLTPGVCRRT